MIILLTHDEGIFLVKLARRSVEIYLRDNIRIQPPPNTPKKLLEKHGVFVTLEKVVQRPDGTWKKDLRGCIGFPYPIFPLVNATIEAAIAAATEDPRFRQVRLSELKNITFEVSVLTKPEKIIVKDVRDYPKMIKVGYDGLIVKRGLYSGLLLPQVPVEYNWDEETFLSQTCFKAGLPPDAWLDPDVEIYKFQAQIFAEIEPDGEVIERKIYLARG